MDELKKLLSEENWIGDNVIETPLSGKVSREYYNCDSYIQHIVSQALGAVTNRLLAYISYMQKKHSNKCKRS